MAIIELSKIEFPEDNTINYEGEEIIIKAYLPIEQKLQIIENILSLSLNPDTGLYLPGHVYIFKEIFMIKYYTNIEIDDAQLDKPMDVFDRLINAPCYEQIKEIINANGDFKVLENLLNKTINKLEKYQTSAYGILDSLKKDYNNMDFDIETLQKKIQNKEGLELVDEVVKKLG